MINILFLIKKNISISFILIFVIKLCFCIFFLFMKFKLWNNINVFFILNEIIDGKWIDVRVIIMYIGICVIKFEYYNKL